jgi:hypothetical protein
MNETVARAPSENPRAVITRYLEAMQSADVETVRTLSTPRARLEYPGGLEFDSPESLFAWSAGRHRWVRHDIDHLDETAVPGATVVYVTGTLAGAWNDGTQFSGIRFIYRFCLRGGRVSETRLWSDVAEVLRRQASARSN